VSLYVSTAIYFLLHRDEWDRFVAPPRHKFVTGATLLQLCGGHLVGRARLPDTILEEDHPMTIKKKVAVET
jgi:hypothetical protein